MAKPETEVDSAKRSTEDTDDDSEVEQFEETFKKLLKVPKSEVDELRKKQHK